MATKADKKRWDDLHVALEQADAAFDGFDSAMRIKYGSSYQSSWLSAGQEKKLSALRERKYKLDDKIIALLVKISPRGERWMTGAPTWWLTRKLTWEDATRPADEPLSVVVPGSYGNRDGTVTERHAPARIRSTRATENMMANRKPRKAIQDLIEELQSWLPNYNHGPDDYPTLLWRILASAPGGDRAEDMGYESFNLGWQEISQLGEVLEAIQDKRDIEDLINGLIDDEEDESEDDEEDD